MKKIIQEYNAFFWEFVHKYDVNNTNVIRKIIHSFQVADVCFSIACKFGLNEKERNFCYLLGLLHDVGRFEQWKIYKTFDDAKSVDHGDLSAKIIEGISTEQLLLKNEDKTILIEAIKYHTKKYIGNDEKVVFYNSIINNADSYANVTTCANGTKQIDVVENGYTQEIYEGFKKQELMRVYSPNTKLDRCLVLTACVYYVKFDFLRKEILEKGYINVICETLSNYLNEEDKVVYKALVNDIIEKYVN